MRIFNLAFSGALRVNNVALVKCFLATVLLAIITLGLRCTPSAVHSKPHKTLVRDVFYIGMTADDALERLPEGYTLEPLMILHEHTKGATDDDVKSDEYFAVDDPRTDYLIPLYFDQDKKLVRVGPTFDEEKYVALYEQRKRKVQTEGKGGRDSTPK